MSDAILAAETSSFRKKLAEYIPIQIIITTSGTRRAYSRSFKSAKERFASRTFPKKTRWYIQSMYTAEKMVPVAAMAVVCGLGRNEPRSTSQSPTKTVSTGSPMEASVVDKKKEL